jgi:hypothetical protein
VHLRNCVRPGGYVVFAAFGLLLITIAWAFGEEIICPNDEEINPSHLAASFSAEYDSKYVFRGVNSLPGSGIATTDAEFEFQHFSLEIWQAKGVNKSYDEFDFTFGYSYIVGSFTFGGGYINYYTPNDDHLKLGYSDTQEFFVSAEWDIGSHYTVTLTYFYDFDKILGGFIEPKFAYCFPWQKYSVVFDPYVSITYDLHYNSDRLAWNNFQTGVEIVRRINDTLKLSGTAEISIPLAAIDQFAKKEGWVGLRVTAGF